MTKLNGRGGLDEVLSSVPAQDAAGDGGTEIAKLDTDDWNMGHNRPAVKAPEVKAAGDWVKVFAGALGR